MKKQKIYKVVDWFLDNKYIIINTIAAVLLSISLFLIKIGFQNNHSIYMIVCYSSGLILAIIGLIWTNFKQKKFKSTNEELINKNDKLAEEIDAANQIIYEQKVHTKQLLERIITNYLQKIFYFDFSHKERVSLYFNGEDGNFYIAGRFSESPDYLLIKRFKFNDHQGCIGKAYTGEGSCYIANLKFDPDDPHYLDYLSTEYNISNEVVKALTMPSRCYFAQVIATPNRRRIGVMVFESTAKDKFNSYIRKIKLKITKEKSTLIHYINESKNAQLIME